MKTLSIKLFSIVLVICVGVAFAAGVVFGPYLQKAIKKITSVKKIDSGCKESVRLAITGEEARELLDYYLHPSPYNKKFFNSHLYNKLSKEYYNMEFVGKPVIYLYPLKKQEVYVRLDYEGKIIADYPAYNNEIKGWKVITHPDGHIVDLADNKEYSYLFWEGASDKATEWDLSSGFVVKGEDAAKFLQETLKKFGLTPKEYNEFIVYWLPRMKDNKYNLIHFAGREYEDTAVLNITPKPDSILRIFMVFKPLEENIKIAPQEIKSFIRNGFTVVEWGGTEIKE